MKIDNTKPVKLLRIFRGKTGNVYQPREKPYLPGELPLDAYTSYYVISAEEEIKTSPVTANTSTDSFNTKPNPSQTELKPSFVENKEVVASKGNKLPINQLGFEDLKSLPNIGSVTAQKIMDLREEAPFVNYDDLNTRVPLPFKKDWASYNLVFESDEVSSNNG